MNAATRAIIRATLLADSTMTEETRKRTLASLRDAALIDGDGDPVFRSVPFAAKLWNVSDRTIKRGIAAGEIESVRIGNSIRVRVDSVKPRRTIRKTVTRDKKTGKFTTQPKTGALASPVETSAGGGPSRSPRQSEVTP